MKNSYKLIVFSAVVTSFRLSTASPTPGPDYQYDISPRAEEAASAPADTSATNAEEAGQRGPGGGFHGGGFHGGGLGRGGFGGGRYGYGYGGSYYGGYPYGYYGGYGYAPCVVGDIRPECIGVGVGIVGVTPGVGVVGTTPGIGVVLKRSGESGQEKSNAEHAYDYENFDLEDNQPLEFVD